MRKIYLEQLFLWADIREFHIDNGLISCGPELVISILKLEKYKNKPLPPPWSQEKTLFCFSKVQ